MSEAIAVSTADRQEIVPISQQQNRLRELLKQNAKGFRAALGQTMALERFARTVVTLAESNTDLYKCDPVSLLLSCFRIAQLGLSPEPALGQAWLIPRKGKAEFQLGYKGALQLVYRSPLVSAVRYGVVREGERFEFIDGKNFRLVHVPGIEGWPENQGKTVAAWCIIDLRSGGAIPRVMYLPEILRHKGRGQGSQPAWGTDFAAMAAKTVIGDACRRAPLDSEIGRALAMDAAGDAGRGQPVDASDPDVIDVTVEDVGTSKTAAFVEAFGAGDVIDGTEAFGPGEPSDPPISSEALSRISKAGEAAGVDPSVAWGRDILEATVNDETAILKAIQARGKRR